jgi:hypothetical protein
MEAFRFRSGAPLGPIAGPLLFSCMADKKENAFCSPFYQNPYPLFLRWVRAGSIRLTTGQAPRDVS